MGLDSTINWLRKYRTFSMRIVAVVGLLIILFTEPSRVISPSTESLYFLIGLVLIVAGVFGRIWAILYVLGRKNLKLVTSGPYSICRNPLYLCSVLISLGAAVMVKTALFFFVFFIPFLVSIILTISKEELTLKARFGEAYRDFCSRVPRLFPAIWKFTNARRVVEAKVKVSPKVVTFAIVEAFAFLLIIPFIKIVEALHASEVIPVLWRVL
ncbi:MAG: isoprenylcysteine carboxylmethyltransferase family protein [Deltaproteobacteria bacterium]|nr:isoprenylcysteine carboxylmethyltransferase family protein [Deltaproteobacteria bacterium]